jgi:hypothetical protein
MRGHGLSLRAVMTGRASGPPTYNKGPFACPLRRQCDLVNNLAAGVVKSARCPNFAFAGVARLTLVLRADNQVPRAVRGSGNVGADDPRPNVCVGVPRGIVQQRGLSLRPEAFKDRAGRGREVSYGVDAGTGRERQEGVLPKALIILLNFGNRERWGSNDLSDPVVSGATHRS